MIQLKSNIVYWNRYLSKLLTIVFTHIDLGVFTEIEHSSGLQLWVLQKN